MRNSPNWLMADRLTGGTLDEIVAQKAADGWSWARIAEHLRHTHGVEVTRVTLYNWYGRQPA